MQKAHSSSAADLRKEDARPMELVAGAARENRLLRGTRARAKGRPYHPMTKRKIECYLRNAIQRSKKT